MCGNMVYFKKVMVYAMGLREMLMFFSTYIIKKVWIKDKNGNIELINLHK